MHVVITLAAGVLFPLAASAQSLTLGPTLSVPQPRPAGDADGDGVDDYSGSTGGNLVVISGASGQPIPHLTRPQAGFGYFAVGDTNADGHDDLVLLNTTASVISGADGTALHTWPPTNPFANYTSVPGGADFDADGFGDVVLVSASQLHEVRSGRTGAILFSQLFGGLLAPTLVAIGDTNGDGYDDVSFAVPVQGIMSVARGPSLAITVFGPNQPRPVGDVNGNGATDRATHPNTSTTTDIVDGATGSTIGSLPHVTLVMPNLVHLGDVDGDGRDDLLAWLPPQTFPPGPGFSDVLSGQTLSLMTGSTNAGVGVVGDIDGDGRSELWTSSGTVVEWVDPAVPVASKMKRRGSSGITSAGTKPRITTRGSCALGRPVFFDVRGTLPNGISLFILGGAVDVDLGSIGAPGSRLYASLDTVMLLLADANGLAVQQFTMPTSPSLLGAAISVQASNYDVAANPLNFVTSNAIDIVTNN